MPFCKGGSKAKKEALKKHQAKKNMSKASNRFTGALKNG